MSLRFSGLLPRAAAIVVVALGTTATLTYAAGQGIGTSSANVAETTSAPTTVVVPDVRNQAFVFAKGALEDAGFAWRVTGSVHGYSANTVVSQSPVAGTKLFDTGAPTITLTLARNGKYPQVGAAADVSPYVGSAVAPVNLAVRRVAKPKPAATTPTATTTTAAATTTTGATTTAATVTTPRTTAAKPTATPAQSRPADFVVPGAKREPADEMPLTLRATQLATWLKAHRRPTNTNVKYWLYQHQWIVTGAKLGWWHGADALRTLIAVDARVQSQWGIGAKSKAVAGAALRYVEAKAKAKK